MCVRGTLARAIVLSMIGVAVAIVATPQAAGACSIVAPAASMTFVGTVSAVDPSGPAATFHVEAVESTDTAPTLRDRPRPPVPFPGVGDRVVVTYATDIDLLATAERYRVTASTWSASEVAWGSTTLASFRRTAGDCGSSELPAGTTHADGSRIEPAVQYTARRFVAADLRWQVGVLVGVGVLIIGGTLLVRRRRRASAPSDLDSASGLAMSEDPRVSGR